MAIMDNGCIEIGNINTKASTEAIRKLKSILDQNGIFHIIDGVMFDRPHAKRVRMKEFHPGRVREANKTKGKFRRRKMHHSDLYKYQKLIVPDLYELNFMSLLCFDSEEADFLSTLVYGGN
jgi:hypothetical protein